MEPIPHWNWELRAACSIIIPHLHTNILKVTNTVQTDHKSYLKIVKVKSLSRVRLFVTPWTVAYQTSPSMGFFQARVPEWVAISFSRRSSRPRDQTWVSRIAGSRFTLSHQGSLVKNRGMDVNISLLNYCNIDLISPPFRLGAKSKAEFNLIFYNIIRKLILLHCWYCQVISLVLNYFREVLNKWSQICIFIVDFICPLISCLILLFRNVLEARVTLVTGKIHVIFSSQKKLLSI